jgi:hypothetical protein
MAKRPTVLLIVCGIVFSAVGAGCESDTSKEAEIPRISREPIKPGAIVRDYAVPVSAGLVPVEAYGVVVGLGRKGSREVPGSLMREMVQYLASENVGSYVEGLGNVSPQRMLEDLDTAVVKVRGFVPAAAPRGEAFDVTIEALPRTNTQSLVGGVLMPVDLRLASDAWDVSRTKTRVLARAGGPVFVNPYLDPDKPEDAARFRQGRVLGGGRLLNPRNLMLQLIEPDHGRALLIQNRINGRFAGRDRVAMGRGDTIIELEIPSRYHRTPGQYLALVVHLPLEYGMDAQILRVAKAMEQPTADHDDLALIWESIGKQVLPQIKSMYGSTNPVVSYYAARTGLRLGDPGGQDVMIAFARRTGSPFQIPAITELGLHGRQARLRELLGAMVNHDNEHVRLAAYEALVRHQGGRLVRRVNVDGGFVIDLVESHGDYVIYATQSEKPKLVLFGRDMPVGRGTFFRSHEGMVLVNALPDSEKLTVSRKVPRNGALSDPFEVDFRVRDLAETMGTLSKPGPRGKIQGLGLSYGEIVSVLMRMCRRGDIPAKFVLQKPGRLQRGFRGLPSSGRPDMPSY